MILLWGLPADKPLLAVRTALQQLGHDPLFLDQRAVLETEINLCIGSSIEGNLRLRDQVIDMSRITAVYVRCYGSHQLAMIRQAGSGSASWQHALSVDDALLLWTELTPALVVNRPSAMASNNVKPYQAIIIQSLGFNIPDTLITTDPDAVLEFQRQHGTIIYKSISGIRSIVTRFSVDHLQRLESVTWCPTQFQQYIPGNDYRVHVVGEQVFACEIISPMDDYRYAHSRGSVAMVNSYEVPADVANRCKALAKAMGMSVAGIDLRCGSDRKWYCFEVNPSPAFTYYQSETGQPIDEAIAGLLLAASVCP